MLSVDPKGLPSKDIDLKELELRILLGRLQKYVNETVAAARTAENGLAVSKAGELELFTHSLYNTLGLFTKKR